MSKPNEGRIVDWLVAADPSLFCKGCGALGSRCRCIADDGNVIELTAALITVAVVLANNLTDQEAGRVASELDGDGLVAFHWLRVHPMRGDGSTP